MNYGPRRQEHAASQSFRAVRRAKFKQLKGIEEMLLVFAYGPGRTFVCSQLLIVFRNGPATSVIAYVRRIHFRGEARRETLSGYQLLAKCRVLRFDAAEDSPPPAATTGE
jgi:hypothetical protein